MTRIALGGLFMLASLWSLPAFADCDSGDTGNVGSEDCDGDGYRKRDGDCNDYDEDINPGEAEDCDGTADENCDGFFNEECTADVVRGSLSGGSTCGTVPVEAALFLPLIGLIIRKRRDA